jgi:hypothetical protein
MKHFTIAYFVSLILHVLVFWLVFRHFGPERPSASLPVLTLYPEWVPLETPPDESTENVSAGSGQGLKGSAASGAPSVEGESPVPGLVDDGGETGLSGIPVPKPMIPLRSPFARHDASAKAKADSMVRDRVTDWFAEQDFSGVKAFRDAVGDRIQRHAGGSDVFSPWKNRTAESHKEEKNAVQFDFLPDETQIQAMSTLYKKGKATQKDLYLDLDRSIPMTAALFDKQLELLVEKGFVTRKKISPENLFGIATPFGVIPIEMSRKNKLNPVYEYKNQVDREKLLAFLQSNEFLLREKLRKAAPKDTAMVQKLIGRCERGMGMLAR